MRPLSLTLAAILVLLAGPADGQTRIPRCFSTETAMPSLFEDRDGYLWIGTGNGVLRFDGSEPPEFFWPDEGLPAGPVWAIWQGRDGVLYFGTERGAGLRTGGSFWSPPSGLGLRTGRVRAIAPGPEGSLFFGHRHEVVKLHAGGRTERISLGLPAKTRSSVHSLLWTRDGTLYAGTMGGEVIALRQGKPMLIPPVEGFRPGEIRAIHERRDGTLYFGTRWGLATLQNGVLQRPREVRDIVNAITEGRDGTLYVATAQGLWIGRGSPEKFEVLTVEHGLSDNYVESVLETRGGDVYIGTNRGLCVYQQDLIQSWAQQHGLPDRAATSVTGDPEGRIFVGTDHGIAVLQGGIWKLLGRENGIPFGVIHALQMNSEGTLHLGMGEPRGGAYTFDHGIVKEIPLSSSRRRGAVATIHLARDGNIYLGGHGGLFVLRNRAASLLYDQDGVLAIDSSPDGSIWFGTFEQGLFRYRNGTFQRWTQEDGLRDNRVDSVTVGRDGRIYAATIRGLSIFHHGRFRNISRSEGLSSDIIRCTLEGKNGLVYVHTDDGIAIVDPEARPGTPAVLKNLSMEDGLVSREGNHGACYQDTEGRLWFGGSRGVTRYDPQKELAQRKPPVPHLSGWRLFDERKSLPTPGDVPHLFGRENYYLTFSFTGIDLTAPHNVRHRYRLAGLETGWTLTDERQARYTNLGPGDYRFEMQASNQPGVWSAPRPGGRNSTSNCLITFPRRATVA